MILGAICTRRCPFCDVAHGRPVAPDANEPQNWRRRLTDMALHMLLSPPLTVTICAMALPAFC
jgi:lipoic acid synthetase